jgi:hypothetical protein
MSKDRMISEDEQKERDYDWFGVDEEGYIGHFTSAGYKLPKSVCASAEDLQAITDYFENIEFSGLKFHVITDLEKKVHLFENDFMRNQYLSSFCEMADRGLYSHDIDLYSKQNLAYFCVAMPERPLRIEFLPPNIRAIVSRIILKGIRFTENSRINYEFTLSL